VAAYLDFFEGAPGTEQNALVATGSRLGILDCAREGTNTLVANWNATWFFGGSAQTEQNPLVATETACHLCLAGTSGCTHFFILLDLKNLFGQVNPVCVIRLASSSMPRADATVSSVYRKAAERGDG
jgi:hypothetical protein